MNLNEFNAEFNSKFDLDQEYIETIIDEIIDNDSGDQAGSFGPTVWIPDEWVILFNGFRGGGKSVGLAHFGLCYLWENFVPVHTNLDYNTETLEKKGFKGMPIPLNWLALISFKLDQTPGTLNQVDEVDDKLDKLRTVANQNVLTTKFLEQLRKRSLKFTLGCQFGHYLPYGTLDQVDLKIQAQDLFFSRAGRERGLGKGEVFLYTVIDHSGYFTGGRKQPFFYKIHGRGIWPYYRTDKLHDPMEFAQKFIIERERAIIDDDDQMYFESQKRDMKIQREIETAQELVKVIWENPLIGFILTNREEINVKDDGTHIIFSKRNIEQVLQRHHGPAGKDLRERWLRMIQLSNNRNPVVKKHGSNSIAILKPSEAREHENDSDVLMPSSLDLSVYEHPYE